MQSILFLDNWLIDRVDCVDRQWYKPKFVKQLIEDFHPETLGYGGYLSAFYDDKLGKYVMYLAVYPPEADPGTFVLRLQSDDPYNWPTPTYDVNATPAWKGFSDVVIKQDGDRFWPLVTRSLKGTPLEDRGYIATCIPSDRSDHNSYAAFSQDGIHFTIDYDNPWHHSRSDTWSGVTWNKNEKLFQISTRPMNVDRRVSFVTTPDFKTFSGIRTVLQPDAQDRIGAEIYSMPVIPYDDMFIGLPHMFIPDTLETRRYRMGGRTETELAYSYNGFNWYRTKREPFVGIQEYGQQGGGQVYVQEMIQTNDNKLLFIASGSKGEHYSYKDIQAMGRSTAGFFAPMLYEMRLDGFCSMKTWSRDGWLRTRTIIPKAGDLQLNVRTTAHTFIKVQVLDGETAEPIPGYTLEEAEPITGDHLFARPQWKDHADLSELIDRPIRLEFQMREAEIFAIRLESQVYIGRNPADTL